MKILVTGATGQLGHDVVEELELRGVECRGVGSRDMDLTDPDAVKKVVSSYAPDAIIHCAAYTAVDRAETDSVACVRVNAEGTLSLARTAADVGAKLLYISTDYVFHGDGEQPFAVDDAKAPLNVYGLTKLWSKEAVRMMVEKYYPGRLPGVVGRGGILL